MKNAANSSRYQKVDEIKIRNFEINSKSQLMTKTNSVAMNPKIFLRNKYMKIHLLITKIWKKTNNIIQTME